MLPATHAACRARSVPRMQRAAHAACRARSVPRMQRAAHCLPCDGRYGQPTTFGDRHTRTTRTPRTPRTTRTTTIPRTTQTRTSGTVCPPTPAKAAQPQAVQPHMHKQMGRRRQTSRPSFKR
eukprot:363245-Chlamydomonas_euryale.AAC.5